MNALQALGESEALDAHLSRDVELAAFAKDAHITVGLGTGTSVASGTGIAVTLSDGRVTPARFEDSDVAMVATGAAWDACLGATPPPTYHHFLAMRMRVEGTGILGDERTFAQHAHIARRLVEVARLVLSGPVDLPADPKLDRRGIREFYTSVIIEGREVAIHVATAGDETLPALVVLHTAGADSRQGHPLMSSAAITARYRVVSFDLPGHGASGRLNHPFGGWTLTTQRYTDSILAVIDALELDRPILLGASMAGEVCLAMAHRAPDRLRGVIACEASDVVPGRATQWPRDPAVNAMAFTAEWIDGLIGPYSPAAQREEIRWQYSQGGLGTFPGDIDFYSGDWDGRDIVSEIDTARCPVVMMTGEYDYSCTPDMSRSTAAKIPGAHFWVMPGLGHFPTCEHPAEFEPHLEKALALIEGSRHD